MQSTVREHRDGGHAGGVFNRYNILKVAVAFLWLMVKPFEFWLEVKYPWSALHLMSSVMW